MPFTPCLDVTLRVAAVPAAPQAALRLESDFVELARDPHRWAFRSLRAEVEGADLVVHALLLEPLEDLYGEQAAGLDGPDLVATDVLLQLLHANCPSWRALDIGKQRVSSLTRHVRRRYWTETPS